MDSPGRSPTPIDALQAPLLLRRLLRAKDRMDAASHEAWPVSRLAEVSGVSQAHFARCFKRAFGIPPLAITRVQFELAKSEIEAHAETARHYVMSVLQLRSKDDAVNFRLDNDMIEHLNAAARLSRVIAKACRSLHGVTVPEEA